MTRDFLKLKKCGCVVKAMLCSISQDNKYEIGSHEHFILCDACKIDESNEIDTLYDMWINDNITDDNEFAGWKEIKNN